MPLDWAAIQEKWRRRWDETRVFESDPDPSGSKFYLTVAYPYPNSPQHIGHGRTYTLADVHARYKRMQGYNVLLPMAFHYTGTPILAMTKRLLAGDQELLDTFKNIYHVSDDQLKELNEPLKIARFFHQEIRQGMKEIGYSIDWRREFTTVDPAYGRFIEWEFQRLRDRKLITQGSHPVGWCPSDGNPVGQHDTQGDVEPEIGEFTLIKFLIERTSLPCATFRPETVFGVTNIWMNPKTSYVKASVDGETWIISEESVERLRLQNRNVAVQNKLKGAELIGKTVRNPMIDDTIPILPADFVDPEAGTGVVMSVPGHAPYDYQALEDLKKNSQIIKEFRLDSKTIQNLQAISIIELEEYSEIPARDAIERLGITSQSDPRLEAATKEVYSKEFHSGRMRENTRSYAGLSVAEAKEKVKRDMTAMKQADAMYDIINKPVLCRCGAECVVKMFDQQWFINYGDNAWKKQAHECLEQMRLLPEDIRPEFKYTINWLREKACARKSGLGTKLPWDKDWIIESLSDSVIYMAYYTIAKHLNQHRISSEKLTPVVFDYLFEGKGDPVEISVDTDIDQEILKAMRQEFVYYYPLDARHSGRDLVPNHLTFFIFNHVALFPADLWPRSIVVNGSVLMEGKKMSKSIGNIIPLREAIRVYGADPLRLAVLATAELLQDADFSTALTKSLHERLEKFYYFAEATSKLAQQPESTEPHQEDCWLMSRVQKIVKAVTEAMNKLEVREAVHHALYIMDQDLAWYTKRTAKPSVAILKEVVEVRTRLLAPFTPFLCEEIWNMLGKPALVASAKWPEAEASKIDERVEEAEAWLMRLLEDVANLLRATSITPKRIFFYVANEQKWKIYLRCLELSENGTLALREVMNSVPEARKLARWTERTVTIVQRTDTETKKRRKQIGVLDEISILRDATTFLSKELNAVIEAHAEDETELYDPKKRASTSEPYRPAIYIE